MRGLERLVNLEKKATEIVLQEIVLFEKQTKNNYVLKITNTETETLLQIKDIIKEAIVDINVSFILRIFSLFNVVKARLIFQMRNAIYIIRKEYWFFSVKYPEGEEGG